MASPTRLSRLRRSVALTAFIALSISAAAESQVKEEMKNMIAADAKKQARQPSPAPKPEPAAEPAPPTAATEEPPADTTSAADAAGPESAADAVEPGDEVTGDPVILPRVELRSRKFTELDKVLKKYDREIADENENTESTELDDAFNDDKVSLSILGGRTTQYRKQIARERVYLLQFERDLVEAKGKTTSPEEKDALQKYIDQIKAMRRDLELTDR